MLRLQYLYFCFLLFLDSEQLKLILPSETVSLLTKLLTQGLSILKHHLRYDVRQFTNLVLEGTPDIAESVNILYEFTEFLFDEHALLLNGQSRRSDSRLFFLLFLQFSSNSMKTLMQLTNLTDLLLQVVLKLPTFVLGGRNLSIRSRKPINSNIRRYHIILNLGRCGIKTPPSSHTIPRTETIV